MKVQVLPSALSDYHPLLAQIWNAPPRKPEHQASCERNWKGVELALFDFSSKFRDRSATPNLVNWLYLLSYYLAHELLL